MNARILAAWLVLLAALAVPLVAEGSLRDESSTTSNAQRFVQAHSNTSQEPTCEGFRNHTTSSAKCSYIQQYCDEGGLWKPLETYYCNAVPNGMAVFLILASVLWLYILFQVLGATADNFFSPILTQLSQDLGLPPRFAGVTFLALGNGAPDLSSTIVAIQGGDYNLSLGALTGAGMFVGTCVAGACIMTAGGAKCRGALIRDVLGYVVAILVLIIFLVDGQLSYLEVGLLFALYLAFVFSVLGADLWHRLVHLKKFPAAGTVPAARPAHPQDVEMSTTPNESPRSESEDGDSSERQQQTSVQSDTSVDYAHMPASRYKDIAWATLAKSTSFFKRNSSLKNIRRQLYQAGALSSSITYVESSLRGGGVLITQESIAEEETEDGLLPEVEQLRRRSEDSSSSDDDDEMFQQRGQYTAPPVNLEPGAGASDAGTPSTPSYIVPNTQAGLSIARSLNGVDVSTSEQSLSSWRHSPDHHERLPLDDNQPVWAEFVSQPEDMENATVWAKPPTILGSLMDRLPSLPAELWNGLFMESPEEIQEMNLMAKATLLLLLPVTLAQRSTIPIIVSEVYSQAWLVVSIVLCPVWMMYFLGMWDSSAVTWAGLLVAALVAAIAAGASSQKDVPPEWSCGSKILFGAALMCTFGFAVAATWIAFVANELVAMLQFFGYLSGVDSALLGLTVLAWGNSVGDLSTNVAMAKRGLSNMALTACFAGPLFNLLVGCAAGFLLWLQQEGAAVVPVRLNLNILMGGMFIVLNCVSLVTIGLLNDKKVPQSTCYWMFTVYGLYVAAMLVVLFLVRD
mmetsp:Transcript_18778/g.52303  ORF Transcript_18778/g.52303 Transcript_18778/m.52303 type:complete len:797 (+) Transcript_18778:155-2545(+)